MKMKEENGIKNEFKRRKTKRTKWKNDVNTLLEKVVDPSSECRTWYRSCVILICILFAP